MSRTRTSKKYYRRPSTARFSIVTFEPNGKDEALGSDSSEDVSLGTAFVGSKGGIPHLDAMLVRFTMRPDERIQIADLAASLGFDSERLTRAVIHLAARGGVVAESDPPTSQTWVRLP